MGSATKEAEAAETAAKAERVRTKYVVLQVTGESITYVGEGEGLNDISAIGEVAGSLGIEEGDFVAVPTRSWRLRSVAVQTKRSVSIR